MECNDAIILQFKYAHAHVLHTRKGYNKALPVNFMANYQEETTLEPIEANSQHFPRIQGRSQKSGDEGAKFRQETTPTN